MAKLKNASQSELDECLGHVEELLHEIHDLTNRIATIMVLARASADLSVQEQAAEHNRLLEQ
jgi:hypothetical protein